MVWFCVVLCGVVRLGMRKTPPCVRSKRLRVCGRFPGTHGGVLNAHTEAFSAFSVFLALSLSSFCLSFFLFSFPLFSSLLFSLSLFPLLSSISSLSATMTMITRPIGPSLNTHGPAWPLGKECMYLGTLLGDHVRIMQETTVLVLLCKPRATWNEVGLFLCGRWKSVLMCDVSVLCVRVLFCDVVRW